MHMRTKKKRRLEYKRIVTSLMSTVSLCPYCGEQFALSSMRAHVVLCSQGLTTRSPPTSTAAPAPRFIRPQRSDRFPVTRSANSFSTDTAPVLSSSLTTPNAAGTAPTLRIDLRASQPVVRPASPARDVTFCPEPRPRLSSRPAGAIPTPPAHGRSGDREDDKEEAEEEDKENREEEEEYKEENRGRGQKSGGKEVGGELVSTRVSGNGRVTNGAAREKSLAERVARVEAENRGLRGSLSALSNELHAAVRDLATLHAIVGGAVKNAEAAQCGVKDMQRRIAAMPASEVIATLRRDIDGLMAQRSGAIGRARMAGGTREANGTGEMVAQLLRLQPSAVMHTGDSSMVSSVSRLWV